MRKRWGQGDITHRCCPMHSVLVQRVLLEAKISHFARGHKRWPV